MVNQLLTLIVGLTVTLVGLFFLSTNWFSLGSLLVRFQPFRVIRLTVANSFLNTYFSVVVANPVSGVKKYDIFLYRYS